jgi:hypothetical protein
MSLLDSLGLNDIPADPNFLPESTYAGVIKKAEFVHNKKNNTYNHVFTYGVTDGQRKGAEKQEWFTLGTPVLDGETIVSLTPTMTDQQKPWYKKRIIELHGVTEAQYDEVKEKNEVLINVPIRFGIKKKEGYYNLSFVERATAGAATEGAASTPAAPATGLL